MSVHLPASPPANHLRLSLGRLLLRSLAHRRARSLSAFVALTVSAAVATALLTLYADLDRKLHHEFRSFGANITITPALGSNALPSDALAKARIAAGPDAAASELAFAVATTDRGTSVVAVGADFPSLRQLNSWWKLDAWPTGPTDVLLGSRAANFIADEHAVTLRYIGQPLLLHGAGRLTTGGDEDSRVYLPMPAFRAWTGVAPSLIELQVPGGNSTIDATLAHLRSALPGLRVDPVRQLVEGETRIVEKTHALMYGAVLLIALTVAVSVLATLSASVLERRRDFALMKALGSSQRQLNSLFLLEALVLAAGAVLAGWVIGSAAAWAISEINFGTSAPPLASVLLPVALLNLIIAIFAATAPLQSLRRFEPAALLRGE